jgi:hypothetical protein
MRNNHLQTSKFFQTRKYFWGNFHNTIFFQTSKIKFLQFKQTLEKNFLLQFNSCIWYISWDFRKIFIFTIDNTIKTCTGIWTYGYIACIIDIINIYLKKKRNLLYFNLKFYPCYCIVFHHRLTMLYLYNWGY